MNELTTALDELKNMVLLGPALLVILLLINIGAVLKRSKRFPDWLIPMTLALLGAAGYGYLAKVMNQDYRATMLPVNIGFGALFGFASVGIHQFVRQSPLIQKIPLVKFLVPASGDTDVIKKEDVQP